MKTHELKQKSNYYDDVEARKKKFEVRKNDRDYKVGDILELKRYHEKAGYLKAFQAFSVSEGYGTYYEQCTADKADTIKVRVTSIMPAKEWNSADAYIFADMHTTFNHVDLMLISKILKEFFETDSLPDDHVILEIEVIE